jgi:hypothetical protein
MKIMFVMAYKRRALTLISSVGDVKLLGVSEQSYSIVGVEQ